MEKRKCSQCRNEYLLTMTFWHRDKKDRFGLQHICKSCVLENGRKKVRADPEANRRKLEQWRKDNPEKARAKDKRWREQNPERAKELAARWREKNREKLREYAREYARKKREGKQDGNADTDNSNQ